MESKDVNYIKSSVSKLDRSKFADRCEIARLTMITDDMSYEDRLLMQKIRYGL